MTNGEMRDCGARIYQIGPSESLPGGMRNVMLGLRDSALSRQYGLEIVPTASKAHRVRTFCIGLLTLMKKVDIERGDCIHLHMSENASIIRACVVVAVFHRRAKIILHSHGGSVEAFFNRINPFIGKMILRVLSRARCLVSLTPEAAKWWANLMPKMDVEVIPNWIDLTGIEGEGPSGDRIILFLGHLGEQKGVDVLLRALALLKESGAPVKCILAGNGDIRYYEQLSIELGVDECCDFIGWAEKEEKKRLFSLSSILVLPSREESFGIVLLEGMAHALPVICGDGGHMHEVVSDAVDGVVVKSGDPVELASAIRELLEDPGRMKKMGANGREKVRLNYSKDIVMKRWDELYSKISS